MRFVFPVLQNKYRVLTKKGAQKRVRTRFQRVSMVGKERLQENGILQKQNVLFLKAERGWVPILGREHFREKDISILVVSLFEQQYEVSGKPS